MNILFYCWEYPPNGTGVGGYIAAMARALTGEGHRVVVVTGRAAGKPDDEEIEGVRIFRRYDWNELGSRAVHQRVLEIARAENIDWIEGADHLGEAAGLSDVTDRPPLVIKVHNSNPIHVVREAELVYAWQRPLIGLSLLYQWRRFVAEHRSFNVADVLLVPSDRLKKEVIRQGLTSPDRIKLIPNPVALCPAGRVEHEVPTVLFVGRCSIGKGVDDLPAIIRRVVERVPSVIFEIAGSDSYARGLGSLRHRFERHAKDVRSSVRFLGVLGSEALDAAYRRAWVLILPSRWDNFPNAVLDAMMREVPVVSSPHGGMPEMLAGTNSPLADPASPAFADAVCGLLLNPQARCRIGAALRERALHCYHPRVIAQRYTETITAALGIKRVD
ncbi:MAG TPA: glycosyltransferase family 4 protein [Kiritimatiellia bacterium]|nr:glycosyltransferase family 4 protein [Kiritimatiellia bacterium]HMO99319.1 glycosyltransferase family 4 protein [Kiritimatiellia bacterium]HMP96077.1 glycosyltransferase family 4 protein [Kiritimatiellia bacterium]